jgi:hypothetical protein
VQKLENSRPKPERMEEILEGGQGPPRAVAPLERESIPLSAPFDVLFYVLRGISHLWLLISLWFPRTQRPNIVRVFCNLQYFIRLPPGYTGQSAFELLVVKAAEFV